MARSCAKCILDELDDPNIAFDNFGVCNHCQDYEHNIKKYYLGDNPDKSEFLNQIALAKAAGKGKKYDVLIGLSGGVDSSFVAYLCWKYGLRALVVHLDNGWNSAISVLNIKNILKRTKFDLYTYVINWAEFRDLQRSYIKANVVDIEVLTDHAIRTILRKVSKDYKIKYVFSGSSITTEGRLPYHWFHNKSDSLNIVAIHKRFGSIPIKTFPITNWFSALTGIHSHKTRNIAILDYYAYNKEEAKNLIKREFNWLDYGGKHYESIFTRFYQGYILPEKFSIDKRKSHYSTLICAGQLTRKEALELMKFAPYIDFNLLNADLDFVLKKLGFDKSEFKEYISAPRIEHEYYGSFENYYNKIRPLYRFLKYRIFGMKNIN